MASDYVTPRVADGGAGAAGDDSPVSARSRQTRSRVGGGFGGGVSALAALSVWASAVTVVLLGCAMALGWERCFRVMVGRPSAQVAPEYLAPLRLQQVSMGAAVLAMGLLSVWFASRHHFRTAITVLLPTTGTALATTMYMHASGLGHGDAWRVLALLALQLTTSLLLVQGRREGAPRGLRRERKLSKQA